jgi:hypothetical protein
MDARRGAPVLVSPDVRRVDTACRRELILGHCHPAAIIRDAFPDVGSSIGSYSGHSSRLRVPGGVCQSERARVLVTCTRAERRRPARKPGQVAAAGCRSRRGIHTGMAGEGHARSRQIRDRANRFALSRTACGSGNFLVPVLERKLAAVQKRHGASDFERRHYALLALMCVYGIELLPDNAAECRARLLGTFASYITAKDGDVWWRAAQSVLALNIVEGDAVSLTDTDGAHITFPEWGYLGRGKFQRRDFRYDALTQRSALPRASLASSGTHVVFVPVATLPRMTVQDLAA